MELAIAIVSLSGYIINILIVIASFVNRVSIKYPIVLLTLSAVTILSWWNICLALSIILIVIEVIHAIIVLYLLED